MAYGDGMRVKTVVPKIHHKILSRKDIMAIIDDAAPEQAVCMVAPYGCGKTIATISWLRGREAAWLSLDERDNDEAILLADLTAAVLSFILGPSYDGGVPADALYNEDPGAFLLEVASRPAREGCEKILVLDDFSHIHHTNLQCFVRDFIASCLGDWRIIVMSRTELPPVFNDLILRRSFRLVNLNELNFSPEEMADYFQMNGYAVPREDILALRKDTEGWPAALNVVLTLSRGGSVGYGEAARAYVRVFFETEVWDGLGEDVRTFLLNTSILETLTPSACHAVTGLGATLPILTRLFQNGLFIAKLEKRDSYRYHRVFRGFLLDKLRTSGTDVRPLYKKLGWWLFERGEVEESFPCFFKARDLYGLRQVLKILNPANMGIEAFLDLVGCLTELDAEELKAYPEIVARIALVHYLTGNVSQMQSLYRLLLKWDEPGALPISPEEYAEYTWELGWLRYLNPGEPTYNNPNNRRHGNYGLYVPHYKQLQISRLAVLSFPSYLRGIRDYGDDGLFNTEKILKRVDSREAYVLDNEKKLKQGESYLLLEEEAVWSTYLILAEYEYEREHFAKAEALVKHVMPLAKDRRYTYLHFICTALLVRLARAASDSGKIGALTARLETEITANDHTFLLQNFHAFELRNRLADGQAGFTDVFMEENRDYTDKSYIFLLYRHLTYVRALLSVGGYSEAIIMLGNLDLLCHKYSRPTDLVEVNVLRAIALYKLGHEDGARRRLTEALSHTKRYGFIRLFSDDAVALWPILELVRKQVNDKYIQTVTSSCKKALSRAGHKMPAPPKPYAELTKTELKILKSLQTGMSYEEIALDNGIRVSTVKSHAHSIYSKLDVSGRTSAVVEARKMGLLE